MCGPTVGSLIPGWLWPFQVANVHAVLPVCRLLQKQFPPSLGVEWGCVWGWGGLKAVTVSLKCYVVLYFCSLLPPHPLPLLFGLWNFVSVLTFLISHRSLAVTLYMQLLRDYSQSCLRMYSVYLWPVTYSSWWGFCLYCECHVSFVALLCLFEVRGAWWLLPHGLLAPAVEHSQCPQTAPSSLMTLSHSGGRKVVKGTGYLMAAPLRPHTKTSYSRFPAVVLTFVKACHSSTGFSRVESLWI